MPHLDSQSLHLTAPGQSVTLNQLVFNKGGAPVVYLQAGIHADEYPAMAALERLRVRLEALEAAGQLVGEIRLVPIANPAGLTQFIQGHHLGRYEADSGQNFNRGYPVLAADLAQRVAPNLGGSQKENDRVIRSAIVELANRQQAASLNDEHKAQLFRWACDADYVLDVHCDDQALAHLYASKRAQHDLKPLAQALQLEVVMLADDSGGASFDEAAPGLWAAMAQHFPQHPIGVGCRGCTIELRGQQDVSLELAQKDADGLVAFLGHIGALTGSDPIAPYDHLTCDLEAVDLLPAPVAGLIHWHAKLGDAIEPGQTVAEIWPLGQVHGETLCTPVLARNAGVLMTRVSRPYARAGETLVKIAGHDPLTWRSGYLLGD